MSNQDEESEHSENQYCLDSKSDNLNNLEESSSMINVQAEGEETFNSAEKRVQTFFTEKKILMLFNFLICHLLVDEPNDPIEYLYDLIDRCVLFRSGLAEAPLLFDKRKNCLVKMLLEMVEESNEIQDHENFDAE